MNEIATSPNVSVWSFNYTDLSSYFKCLGISNDYCHIQHVHGLYRDNSIILGVHNDADINPTYDYLKKLSNPLYSFSGSLVDLQNADNVIIFGHSLGETDSDYFRPWFNSLINDSNKLRNLYIYTFDDKSATEINNRIANLTGGHMSELKCKYNVQLFCTFGDCCEV